MNPQVYRLRSGRPNHYTIAPVIYSLVTDDGSNVLKVRELLRSDFAYQNDEDECDVTEASDSELLGRRDNC